MAEQKDCNLCQHGHGGLVCDCGLYHDEHVFAGGNAYRKCEGYSQKKLNRTYGKDVRRADVANT